MKKLFIIYGLIFLSSCQNGLIKMTSQEPDTNSSLPSELMTPEEREVLLPNDLFIAVADKKNEEILQEILNKNGQYLLETNEKGDTPLGTAIQFYNLQGALFLADQLSPENFLHTNLNGEGYLYLASKKAYVDLIQLLSYRFYESRSSFLEDKDYEFSDLDMKTKSGERALHVAQSYQTAEALEYEYWRGTLEFPYRKFQFLQNNEGQTFLHTAIRDQNSDLLRWGLSENCLSKEEWEEKSNWTKPLSFLWKGMQLYGSYVSIDWDNLINTTDNQGLSPMNASAKSLYLEAIQILSTCQWVNYLLKDEEGNIPLQNFLLALDPLKGTQAQNIKDTFTLLIEGQTRLTWSVKADHVNFVNSSGNSSLHISAELADPFFYQELKKYGNEEQINAENKTAKEIFKSKRALLKQAKQ